MPKKKKHTKIDGRPHEAIKHTYDKYGKATGLKPGIVKAEPPPPKRTVRSRR